MLCWTLTFVAITIIAGALGLGGISVSFANIVQVLFVVFILLVAVALIGNAMRDKAPL